VLGNLVATEKHPAFAGHKLMVVEPVDEKLAASGKDFVAVDRAQSGPGDVVLVLSEGTGVRQILGGKSLPIRSLIVGIVDAVDAPGKG
jgi:microcompartment protein CcmK/EutM